MANRIKYGFVPVHAENYTTPQWYVVAASQTIALGDPVIMNSAGRVEVAVAGEISTAIILGVSASYVENSTVDDPIQVYDNPNQIFEAMVSTGALADPYTTRSALACFDLARTTGAFYVNAAAFTNGIFKCVGNSSDPEASEVGANQRKLFKFLSTRHILSS